MSENYRPNYDVVPWQYVEEVRELNKIIKQINNPQLRQESIMNSLDIINRKWPHYGEYYSFIGDCYTLANPKDFNSLELTQVSEIEGLSEGFGYLNSAEGGLLGLKIYTGKVIAESDERLSVSQLYGYVNIDKPFTILRSDEDLRSTIDPDFELTQPPDEQFSFQHYSRLGERYIYANGDKPDEVRKDKILNYIRQRWPHGECNISVTAEYSYQISPGTNFTLDRIHLFSIATPIRGNLIDFGFFPRKISSDRALSKGKMKLGIETLSLIVEPNDYDKFSLAKGKTLIIPTSQRLAAVVHSEKGDIRVA